VIWKNIRNLKGFADHNALPLRNPRSILRVGMQHASLVARTRS